MRNLVTLDFWADFAGTNPTILNMACTICTVCPAVRPSDRPSVRPSVRPSSSVRLSLAAGSRNSSDEFFRNFDRSYYGLVSLDVFFRFLISSGFWRFGGHFLVKIGQFELQTSFSQKLVHQFWDFSFKWATHNGIYHPCKNWPML